jgi:polyhydroxybutyrate depolymerase
VASFMALSLTGLGCSHPVNASERSTSPASTSKPASTAKPTSTASAASAASTVSTKTYSMTVAGLKRSYEVITPTAALPKPAPIIFMLSGLGATVPQEITRDMLVPYASADEAEIVYPVAIGASWNAIGCCAYAQAHNVNDVAFLKALVAKVDPGHARLVYVVGYSNGARLAFRIACDDPSLFDGYATVKGVPTPGCVLSKPVLLVQLASVDDPEIPYKPGDGGLEPLPVTTLMARLRLSEKCPVKPVVTHTQELTMTTWSPCGSGTRLGFAVWTDGKHSFPRAPTSVPGASQVIWSFFTDTPLKALP